jgi:gas vesicle protein
MREKEYTQSSGIGFGSVLFGAVIGAALGLLFAPAKGDETRENVSNWIRTQREKSLRAKEQFYGSNKKTYREGKEELVP